MFRTFALLFSAATLNSSVVMAMPACDAPAATVCALQLDPVPAVLVLGGAEDHVIRASLAAADLSALATIAPPRRPANLTDGRPMAEMAPPARPGDLMARHATVRVNAAEPAPEVTLAQFAPPRRPDLLVPTDLAMR